MRLAFHYDPPLAEIPQQLDAEGVDAFQTILRNPHRFGKQDVPDEADQQAYLQAAAGRELCGIVHATLLINLASGEGRIRNSSRSALVGDLKLAKQLGLSAVCFHLGYEKGHTDRSAALEQAVKKLAQVVEEMPDGVCAALENTCEGGELADTVEEMAWVVDQVDAPKERLGVLVDTCHLHAAGFDLATAKAGEQLADALDANGLLDRLVGFHLNDSQGPLGGRRDRHAPPGEGTIGEGLLSVASHAAFSGLPAVLEISLEASRRAKKFLAQAGV